VARPAALTLAVAWRKIFFRRRTGGDFGFDLGKSGPMSAVLPTYARYDLEFARGEGAHLFTADGTCYLDFAGGIAVNALGHAHAGLVKALTEQAGQLWHTSNLYRIKGQERLAERLCGATFADKVFFTNSGAEAIECALKMARRYHHVNGQPERYRVLTFEGAFHGRTLATIAAGGQAKHLDGFGPPVDGFDQIDGWESAKVRAVISERTAAILIEPVQGEGGVRVVPNEVLRDLRQIADDMGVLLILDEVQCGMARTGRLFAHEWAGIEPDIMAIAKAIGGGFPLGACLASENAAKGMTAGTHGSTFGGNPLAMAVGNAVLDEILAPGFVDAVQAKALVMRQRLARVMDEFPDIIEDVRGIGLMLGLKLKVAPGELITALIDERLLAVPAGDGVVRLLPPLIVTDDQISEAVERIAAACLALRRRAAPSH